MDLKIGQQNYDSLNSWGSVNVYCAGPFYPVTKSTDNYPVSTGTYSIKVENDTSLIASYCGLGVVGAGKFPIAGHPTSLTGYYKFLPQNGDTMIISLELFNLGTWVASAAIETTVAAPNWTSFNTPFDPYTTADSGSVRISAYCSCGPQNIPYGNSVLYVDNLNFDSLIIVGISEVYEKSMFSVYPNPFSTQTTLQTKNLLKNATLTVDNYFGQIVKQIKSISGHTVTLSRDNLASGLYFIRLTEDSKLIATKKLLITD